MFVLCGCISMCVCWPEVVCVGLREREMCEFSPGAECPFLPAWQGWPRAVNALCLHQVLSALGPLMKGSPTEVTASQIPSLSSGLLLHPGLPGMASVALAPHAHTLGTLAASAEPSDWVVRVPVETQITHQPSHWDFLDSPGPFSHQCTYRSLCLAEVTSVIQQGHL